MNEKDILIENIKEMNTKFKELCDQNERLIIKINKAIMNRDIKDYLNKENISFKVDNYLTYSILGYDPFKEIDVSDCGFHIMFKNTDNVTYFYIELREYSTFGDSFKIENHLVTLSSDYFINSEVYNLTINVIKDLIDKFNKRILKLENNVNYLQNHSDITNYEYQYGLDTSNIFFKDINDIMIYINNEI